MGGNWVAPVALGLIKILESEMRSQFYRRQAQPLGKRLFAQLQPCRTLRESEVSDGQLHGEQCPPRVGSREFVAREQDGGRFVQFNSRCRELREELLLAASANINHPCDGRLGGEANGPSFRGTSGWEGVLHARVAQQYWLASTRKPNVNWEVRRMVFIYPWSGAGTSIVWRPGRAGAGGGQRPIRLEKRCAGIDGDDAADCLR
jgi:hypothetical protein